MDIPAWVQAAATVVLVGITVKYAMITKDYADSTREILAESKRQRLDEALPVVVAKLGDYEQPPGYTIPQRRVWLHNSGHGTALEISTQFGYGDTDQKPVDVFVGALGPGESCPVARQSQKGLVHIECRDIYDRAIQVEHFLDHGESFLLKVDGKVTISEEAQRTNG
ncbi:MAG TPA: hypothetical protein VFI02_13240 [Armatimonadota bacterium]|nr:hypothetical protein [Armatimonadota bacterium]